MEQIQLANVRKLVDYRQQRAHVFPSNNALQWFVRQHRTELVEAGAIVMLTGQWHAVDDKFDAFVMEAGRQAARRHAGGFAR